jgi:hypothetical protein
MTYWNEISDTHIKIYKAPPYQACRSIREDINSEGYVGDLLSSSDVIFLGSCDIMSAWYDSEKQWARHMHKTLYSSSPFIALGTKSSSVPTLIRRLYAYIQNFGAPKEVYLTIPRFDSYEYVNDEGVCYTASTNMTLANLAFKYNIVTQTDYEKWIGRLNAQKAAQNAHNIQYVLEERFAFLETICKLHDINLHWTFNPTSLSIEVLYENLACFENISNFMKESFVGLPTIKDMLRDYSIGPETQMEIVNKFMTPEPWNYSTFCHQARQNYEWFINYNNLPKEQN